MLFDCHWHPTEYERSELKEKIFRAKKEGVKKSIGVPIGADSCESLLDISKKFESLYPTVGVHPQSALEADERVVEKVSELMSGPEIVAVGEIGVDLHFLNQDTKDKQLKVFKELIERSVENNLPVILHCPRGEPITFEEVKKAGVERAVFHWYTGPLRVLRKILDVDEYYISVTPAVIYSGKLQRVVELTDLDKLLLESDAPTQFRDIGDGEPSHVSMVAEKISEIKGIEVDRVEEVTTRNAKRFFGL